MTKPVKTQTLRALAESLGIPALGIAAAQPLTEAVARLRAWCDEGHHGAMEWLPRSLEVRANPQQLLPGARSVVMVALPYQTNPTDLSDGFAFPEGRIARYAVGGDYHLVLREKLNALAAPLQAAGGECRVFVDAEPVLERAYAREAGLGFIGKNNCLIHPEFGSWISLGGILTTLEVPPDAPLENGCGECRRCLDACPGGALIRAHCLDARKCLSYWTVENRGAWSEEVRARVGDRLFGCDACQEVCPHNQEIPSPHVALETLLSIVSNREFEQMFNGTALLRTGRRGLLRNALAVAAHLNRRDLNPQIQALAENPKEHDVLRETARWALENLRGTTLAHRQTHLVTVAPVSNPATEI